MPELTADTYQNISVIIECIALAAAIITLLDGLAELAMTALSRPRDE